MLSEAQKVALTNTCKRFFPEDKQARKALIGESNVMLGNFNRDLSGKHDSRFTRFIDLLLFTGCDPVAFVCHYIKELKKQRLKKEKDGTKK